MLRLGLAIFGCMLLAATINTVLPVEAGAAGAASFRPILITAICLQLMTFPIVHLFLRGEHQGWVEAFGLNAPHGSRSVLLAIGVTGVSLVAAWFLKGLSGWVLQWLGQESVEQTTVTAVQTAQGLLPQMGLAVIAILLAPAAEELLFRGILYPFLKQWGHPRMALWATSLLFGAAHFNLVTFVPLAFFGAALAWLYERTGNLLASFLAHSLFNLANYFWLVMAGG